MNAAPSTELTAILTCRNAEATLERCLEHLLWHGANVVVVDNGSTDGTAEIATAFASGGSVEVQKDPYLHAFDLTRQLRLKRDIIQGIGKGWIIHADADEFLDTPDNCPLAEVLPFWDQSDVQAFHCDEYLFLPLSEDDVHQPSAFENTMRNCLRLDERNPKQRVFRATAPLSLWMATGGHTVVSEPAAIASLPLRLRHYFGLSLDQIRSEYLARIYAPHDLGKLWHMTRRGSAMSVVAPDASDLTTLEAAADVAPSRRVPVFQPIELQDDGIDTAMTSDVSLICAGEESWSFASRLIEQQMPGLRVSLGKPESPRPVPKLTVLEHPQRSFKVQSSDPVVHGEQWLRLFANARQAGLMNRAPYAEVRVEDLEETPKVILDIVRRLLSSETGTPILADASDIRRLRVLSEKLAAITSAFARDLGYA